MRRTGGEAARETAAVWRERAEAVAEEIRTRTGLPAFASAAHGGLVIRLDDAETWVAGQEVR